MAHLSKWKYFELREVCKTTSGGTPSRSNKAYYNGEIPWVKSGELIDGPVQYIEESITQKGLENSSAKIFPSGTLLIALYGATVGKLGVLTSAAATNQAVCAIFPKKNLERDFLFYFLLNERDALIESRAGGAQPNISQEILRNVKVPLPPLSEQTGIASILARSDRLRRLRRYALDLSDTFLQSVFLQMFDDPVTNPMVWPQEQLKDVVAVGRTITYGIVQAGPHLNQGIPYIRSGDIKNGIIVEDQLLKTSPEIAAKYKRSEVWAGELVFSIRASVGMVAEVPVSLHRANLTQGTARISPGKRMDGKFLLWALRTKGIQHWVETNTKGATFREITLGKLRETPMIIPPADLQAKFAMITLRFESLQNHLHEEIRQADHLFETLLHKSFQGGN